MSKVVSIEAAIVQDVYDIQVDQYHNFIANGVVVHNCMVLAQKLAGMSASDSYKLLKGVGKKIKALVESFRVKFVEGCRPRIEAGELTEKEAIAVFDLIESFASYGFNKSVDIEELVWCNGKRVAIGDVVAGDVVLVKDGDSLVESKVVANHDHGNLPAFRVTFDDGSSVVCSINHKFETGRGKIPVLELTNVDAVWQGIGIFEDAVDRHLQGRRVVTIQADSTSRMCDLEVEHPAHNYCLANGLVSCNSHAYEYGAVTAVQLWLRHNYFPYYMTALINNTKQGKKKHGSENMIVDYVNYARKNGVKVLPPDVNKSGCDFKMESGCIRFSLQHIRNVASMAEPVAAKAPFASIKDFDDRVRVEAAEVEEEEGSAQQDLFGAVVKKSKGAGRRVNRRVVESMIYAGALDCFGERVEVMRQFGLIRKIDVSDMPKDDAGWEAKEIEMVGLCMSKTPLRDAIEDLARDKKWKIPSTVKKPDRMELLGRVDKISKSWSKNGNKMCTVTLGDDVSQIKFYVFQGQIDDFTHNVAEGDLIRIGLSKFEDGDALFYAEKKGFEVVKLEGSV